MYQPDKNQVPFPTRMRDIERNATRAVRRKHREPATPADKAALAALRKHHAQIAKAIAALEAGDAMRAESILQSANQDAPAVLNLLRRCPAVQERDRLLREDREYRRLLLTWEKQDRARSTKVIRRAFATMFAGE